MPVGMGPFPEIPSQEPISPPVDQRWDHDMAEVMADALKQTPGIPGRRLSFDEQLEINQRLRDEDPSKDRKEQHEKVVQWTDRALKPLSEIYDRDPARFANMPTGEFMDLANRITGLEAREKSATAKLEELRREVISREASLQEVRVELNELLHTDQQPPTLAENQE